MCVDMCVDMRVDIYACRYACRYLDGRRRAADRGLSRNTRRRPSSSSRRVCRVSTYHSYLHRVHIYVCVQMGRQPAKLAIVKLDGSDACPPSEEAAANPLRASSVHTPASLRRLRPRPAQPSPALRALGPALSLWIAGSARRPALCGHVATDTVACVYVCMYVDMWI